MAGNRAGRRAFRPALDGRLEPRCLLSRSHPVQHFRVPSATVLNGGRGALVTDFDREQYRIVISDDGFTGVGATVQAIPVAGGQFDLIVRGSTPQTILEIDPFPHPKIAADPPVFSTGVKGHDGVLHIRNITIMSGQIGQILAYRTADLSGTVIATATTPVDRLAFKDIEPGAVIATGGDVDTFDVFNDITLTGPPASIQVGRDLNFLNVGGNITIGNGSAIIVGRDIGLVAQPAKGTDPGGQGATVNGDLTIGPNSTFLVKRNIDAPFIINGNVVGASRFIVLGTTNPNAGQGVFVPHGTVAP
jgi:hypothetical protein